MNREFLLQNEDMIRADHIPVIVLFKSISDRSRFLHVIDPLSDGVGYGNDFACCLFPDDVNIESEKFGDGVEFSLRSGEEIVLTYEEFYYYLNKACMNYLKKYPEDSEKINQILEKVRKRYDIAQ